MSNGICGDAVEIDAEDAPRIIKTIFSDIQTQPSSLFLACPFPLYDTLFSHILCPSTHFKSELSIFFLYGITKSCIIRS